MNVAYRLFPAIAMLALSILLIWQYYAVTEERARRDKEFCALAQRFGHSTPDWKAFETEVCR